MNLAGKRATSRRNSHPSERYTLITGSSQGIGRAMAEECARRGMPLLLVALDDAHLQETTEALQARYGQPVRKLGIDLTTPGAAQSVWRWCQEQGIELLHLINNAGFGRNGLFEHLPMDEYLDMMRLNNQVMVELTHCFLPQLKATQGARILNMCSLEYALPNPYKAVYTGTKNFVYAFSLALAEEVREDGLTVSVLAPGPVLTNADGLKRIQAMGPSARLLVMMPEQVASIAIRGMLRGKAVIVPGRVPAFVAWLGGWFPRAAKMRILERLFRKYRTREAVSKASQASATQVEPHRGAELRQVGKNPRSRNGAG